jgi:Uma2 family endonuclease
MIVSTTKMTAQQFLELGQDPPGVRLELVNGEVAVSPSPTPEHSYVVLELAAILRQHVKGRQLGRIYADVDTIVGKYEVRRPDILYFSNGRLNLVGRKAMEGPPDLAVEVISPSSIEIDREDKFAQYAAAGIAHYWIVDPAEKTIEAYRLVKGQYEPVGNGRDEDAVRLSPFADLEIPLGELWHPEL